MRLTARFPETVPRRRPRLHSVAALVPVIATFGALTLALVPATPVRGAGYLVTVVDTANSPGAYTSMRLDAAGNPVVSYQATGTQDLRVLHCDDPTCSGGGESIETPVTANDVAQGTSLQLDASGNPIIAYHDATAQRLRILRCDDPNCAPGGETIATPDPATKVGRYPSLQLDANGNPAVAYRDDGDVAVGRGPGLRVLRCTDPACQGPVSIAIPDTTNSRGMFASLQLDADDHPVVAHHDIAAFAYDLVLMRCNDPGCAGGDESISTPDTDGQTGEQPSLQLDAAGHPIVSYQAGTSGNKRLRLLRCDDPDCAPGGDTVEQPDPDLGVGAYSSLRLDSSGYPVIAYYAGFAGTSIFFDLRVVRCNDAACSGGDDEVTTVDGPGFVGEFASLELDALDNPIVAYRSEAAQALKVAAFGEFPYPLPACAVAWWTGDETTAAEIGPDVVGNPAYDDAMVGRGFDLDGDDVLSIDGFPTLTDAMSVEMWVRPVPTGLTQTLLSRWDFPSVDDGARVFTLQLSPLGRLDVSIDDHSARRPEVLPAEVPELYDGSFHHVAATWDGSSTIVYIDGTEVARRTSLGGILNPAPTTQFRIGNEAGGWFSFTGVIDEPTVYSCALTSDDVAGIFEAGSDGKR